jgi:hypothetical protein
MKLLWWEQIGQQTSMKMLPQELEKGEAQFRRFLEDQDQAFQIALADAVRKGLENTPKCPSLDEILG